MEVDVACSSQGFKARGLLGIRLRVDEGDGDSRDSAGLIGVPEGLACEFSSLFCPRTTDRRDMLRATSSLPSVSRQNQWENECGRPGPVFGEELIRPRVENSATPVSFLIEQ